MCWGVYGEIWELFSLSCPYADANAEAPPKQLFCCVFQKRLPTERRWWGQKLLLQVEMSLQEWGSCFPVFVEMLMLKLTLESGSFTAMLSHVTVMWLHVVGIKLISSLCRSFWYIICTNSMHQHPKKVHWTQKWVLYRTRAQHCIWKL